MSTTPLGHKMKNLNINDYEKIRNGIMVTTGVLLTGLTVCAIAGGFGQEAQSKGLMDLMLK